MRVRMLTAVSGPQFSADAGAIVANIDAETAKAWIESGYAVAVDRDGSVDAELTKTVRDAAKSRKTAAAKAEKATAKPGAEA